jgi:hypothetical protein
MDCLAELLNDSTPGEAGCWTSPLVLATIIPEVHLTDLCTARLNMQCFVSLCVLVLSVRPRQDPPVARPELLRLLITDVSIADLCYYLPHLCHRRVSLLMRFSPTCLAESLDREYSTV